MALNPQSFSVPYHLGALVEALLEEWRSGDVLSRLWGRDASLWTGADEARWLGWLEGPGSTEPGRYEAIAGELRAGHFSDVLLLGMGGSVLCPLVFAQVFGRRPSSPKLHVLDSVDPVQIRNVERAIDPSRMLVIVSSKSGSTLESRILMEYFLQRVRQEVGSGRCGERFIAITDPGSPLETSARELGFRRVCPGRPDIGGRFSAFSDFGLLPLATMGVDVGRFLGDTMPMVEACGPHADVLGSPGALLGAVLGILCRAGRDKATFVVSPSIQDLGLWIEQLLAESTGKSGLGLIPVTGEKLRSPGRYDDDRLFVYIRFIPGTDGAQEEGLAKLEASGQPVVRIDIGDPYRIGQELFRWEIATALAGSHLGINPFDQPDVEASKQATRQLMSGYAAQGAFPPERPAYADDGLRVFAAGEMGERLGDSGRWEPGLAGCMQAFLGSVQKGDYCAILAYAPMDEATTDALERLRDTLGERAKTAATLGFGPRYLHSVGQIHKGGPNSGVFLVLVSEDTEDLAVPGHAYTFGVVKAAQARADAEVLTARNRRVIRIDIAGGFVSGVGRITAALRQAGGRPPQKNFTA